MLSREGPLPLHRETEAHAGGRIPEVASEISCRSWEMKGYTVRPGSFPCNGGSVARLGLGILF